MEENTEVQIGLKKKAVDPIAYKSSHHNWIKSLLYMDSSTFLELISLGIKKPKGLTVPENC